ncbi:MAG TPA: TIGR00645 family protein [Stellaceae bacterium]|nr:TIGR00645 family protein [Stellaceae bacterium]
MDRQDQSFRQFPTRRGVRRTETWLEAGLFAGRWLLAPVYVGLLVALGMITVKFVQELVVTIPGLLGMKERELVIFVLSLVDLALLGNLLLMVAFVGYENFVSKLHVETHEDRPGWIGLVDFSGLKIKLLSSIVAISAIHLLRTFLDLGAIPKDDVAWQLAIHLGFVVSGLLLAWMNRLLGETHPTHPRGT